MVDRANVYVKDYSDDAPGVFLYTHWAGTELPETVRLALSRRERWDDPQYLARIVFCEMVDGDNGTTGYGISAVCGDGDNRIIALDPAKQTVAFTNLENLRDGQHDGEVSMDAYVAQEEARWPGDDED